MDNPTLAEARRIASQPVTDRLDGKQGEEAKSVIIRILEESGLDFVEALRLTEAYGWSRWTNGLQNGREVYFETERI